MALPTDTFKANTSNPYACDYCGRTDHDLWHNDWTGEALCADCDTMRVEQEEADAEDHGERVAAPGLAARVEELERLLKFANDTSEMLLEQLTATNEKLALALRIIEGGSQ